MKLCPAFLGDGVFTRARGDFAFLGHPDLGTRSRLNEDGGGAQGRL